MIAKYYKWAALFVLIPYGVLAQSDFTDVQTFIDSNITRNFLITYFDNNKNTNINNDKNGKILGFQLDLENITTTGDTE
mgnify:CR=1 FL=1